MENLPNRFDRILAILIQLQSKKIVKARDLADRFGVTLRTIYRDIKSLDQAGVPVLGEAGSGYSIMEGYRLPPVMFSREEASSFVAAEKLMNKYTDEQMRAQFTSAMYKVKSVLRTDEKNMVEYLEGQIDIVDSPLTSNKNNPHALQHLVESIATRRQVNLIYRSMAAEEETRRQVEVIGLFYENKHWYLFAWCHLRADYRQFRIDRIVKLTLTDSPFTKTHPSLQELRNTKLKRDTTKVRISVKKSVAPHLRYDREYHGFVSEKLNGDWIEMQFECCDVETSFARWYLMFADYARIEEPAALKQAVRKILSRAMQMMA